MIKVPQNNDIDGWGAWNRFFGYPKSIQEMDGTKDQIFAIFDDFSKLYFHIERSSIGIGKDLEK